MFKKVRTGVIALAALGAIAVGAASIAGAASNSSTTATTPGQGSNPSMARPDPARMSHGPGETLLTDGTADKVRQAALGKVPGASVIRVETDNEGSPYEAHLRKSDGTEVTVKVNQQFEATTVENGFGGGGPPPGMQQ